MTDISNINISLSNEQIKKAYDINQDEQTSRAPIENDSEHNHDRENTKSKEKVPAITLPDDGSKVSDKSRMTDEEYEAALKQPKHLRTKSVAEKIDFERQFRARKAEEERKAQTDNVFSRLRETADLRSQKLAEMETERKTRVEEELQREKQRILEEAEAERAAKKLRNVAKTARVDTKTARDSTDHSRKTSLELEEEEAAALAKRRANGSDVSPDVRAGRMSLSERMNQQKKKANGELEPSPEIVNRELRRGSTDYYSKPSDELTNKLGMNRQDSLKTFEQEKATSNELRKSIAEARLQMEEEEKFEKQRRAKEQLDEIEKTKKTEEEKKKAAEEEKRKEDARKKQEAIKAFEEKRRWEKLTNEQKAAEEAEKARIAAEEARIKKEEEERAAEAARKKAAEEAAAAEAARKAKEQNENGRLQFQQDDSDDEEKPKPKADTQPTTTTTATTTPTTTTTQTEQEQAKQKEAADKAAYVAAEAAAQPPPEKVTGCKCVIM